MIKHKFFTLLVAICATTALWASNTITYTATEKVSGYDGSLDVGKTTFGPAIISHDFSNGIGTITCSGEITKIGEGAFEYCSGLTSITIPNSVTTIGNYAFGYCFGLTSVTIPNSVTTIGDWAFGNCRSLTSVTIPNSVTTIREYAFVGCYSLTSVTIGNSVTSIKDYAFSNCSSLTSVTIPNSVTTIGEWAFWSCYGLTSINVDASNTHYASIDGVLFNYAKDTLIQYPRGNPRTEYTIPNSVTTIGDHAFYKCSGLTSITIPNSVTTIGSRAFGDCSGLTSVTIPNSVTSIGSYAFYECYGLTSVTIGNSVTSIGESAFRSCYSLTSVTIGNSVTSIGEDAFYNCSGLTSITIPNSVTSIGEAAFYNCSGLTSITIPNSVTTIGNYAFYGCSGLTSVTIGNSVTSIGEAAFYNCSGLTSVTIGNSVTSIGEDAFAACYSLTSVTCEAATPPTCGSYCFYDVDKSIPLYVPAGSVDAYKAADEWKDFTDIRPIITDGIVITYTATEKLEETTDTWSAGLHTNAFNVSIYYHTFSNGVGTVTFAGEVTTIGNNAFYNCKGLISVTIPNSVTSIGDYAFFYCNNLTSITIPNSVTTIGEYAFYNCSGLASVTIPNSVTTIGEYAFYGLSNKNFKTIEVSNSVETIGKYAFANCSYLKTITLGSKLEDIGEYAFQNDERLLYVNCYAEEPPLLQENAFDNYDIYLQVPCDVLDEYKVAKGWKLFNKENVSCISAEETPITTDDVTVVPADNQATFTWPQNEQAAGYSIEITKDGVVFCTLKFNGQGQLTGIAFAPGRGGEQRTMPAAEMTANGWQFTVTGLDQASKYSYALDALNAAQQSIKHYQGEFTTTGGEPTGINGLTIDNAQGMVKMIIDGQVLIRKDGKTYNVVGQEVK